MESDNSLSISCTVSSFDDDVQLIKGGNCVSNTETNVEIAELLNLEKLRYTSDGRSLDEYRNEKQRVTEMLCSMAKRYRPHAGVYFDRYQVR